MRKILFLILQFILTYSPFNQLAQSQQLVDECSESAISDWIKLHTMITTQPFKVYHWGERGKFPSRYVDETWFKGNIYPNWDEYLLYKGNLNISDSDATELNFSAKLKSDEPQSLDYFKNLSNNYFWKYLKSNMNNYSARDWDLGMGFYAAIDPIQSIEWAYAPSWMLMEITVPIDVKFLEIDNHYDPSKGPCGVALRNINPYDTVSNPKRLSEKHEDYFFKTLLKNEIQFIAFNWAQKSLTTRDESCNESNIVHAFNFINSNIAEAEGFSWKFFTNNFDNEDTNTLNDFNVLEKTLKFFFETYYQSYTMPKYKKNYQQITSEFLNFTNIKFEENDKQIYFKNVYSPCHRKFSND